MPSADLCLTFSVQQQQKRQQWHGEREQQQVSAVMNDGLDHHQKQSEATFDCYYVIGSLWSVTDINELGVRCFTYNTVVNKNKTIVVCVTGSGVMTHES